MTTSPWTEGPLVRTAPGLCGPALLGGLSTRLGFPTGGDASPQDAPKGAPQEAPQDGRAHIRETLALALGSTVDTFAWCKQVHGATVIHAQRPGYQGEADALVSTNPALGLLVSVADCLPVLLWDPKGRGFAVAHAGWRGLVAGVLPATVSALTRLGVPADSLRAWIGPSICVEHFEVGDEVAALFPPEFVERRSEWSRPHLDLKAFARRQLHEAGLRRGGATTDAVSLCPDCTYHQSELYHSYRRDHGICGRHLAYLLPEPFQFHAGHVASAG